MSGSEFFGGCFVRIGCPKISWFASTASIKTDILSIPPFSTSRVILVLVTSGYIPLCSHYGWFYTPHPTQIRCLNVFLGGSSHDRMMFTSTKLVAPVTQAMSLHLLQTLSIESMCFLNKYINI